VDLWEKEARVSALHRVSSSSATRHPKGIVEGGAAPGENTNETSGVADP